MRNLDITTLRSFVTVAETGGVTRAAGYLHLTQSAVSMQLKRLEELMDLSLFDRSGRGVSLTASGEQLLVYARRMVAMNDEIMQQLTDTVFEGEIKLGVPHDIVYPVIPQVLKQFSASYPRVRMHLITSSTVPLMEDFHKGNCDLILTTETQLQEGGETLCTKPLCWIGARDGTAWRQRPLRLTFGRKCTFRPKVLDGLDHAEIPWDLVVETDSDRTIEATVAADLAVHAMIEGTEPPHLERIDHSDQLPTLPAQHINLYGAKGTNDVVLEALVEMLRRAFGA